MHVRGNAAAQQPSGFLNQLAIVDRRPAAGLLENGVGSTQIGPIAGSFRQRTQRLGYLSGRRLSTNDDGG